MKPEWAENILQVALSKGADFAELFIEDGISRTLRMNNTETEACSHVRTCGAGVRVFSGTRSAYAYCSGQKYEDLLDIAAQAAEALLAVGIVRQDLKVQPLKQVHAMKEPEHPFAAVSAQERMEYLLAGVRAAQGASSELVHVGAGMMDSDQKVWIFRSDGVWAEDRRLHARLFLSATLESEGRLMSCAYAPGMGQDYSFFLNTKPEEAALEAVRRASVVLHAPECPACTVPVVLANGFGGVLFHEACGHPLESSAVAYGNSPFAGKLGEQVASRCVSAVDDGTIPDAWGSLGVDDEGNPTTRNLLIENGILKGYMVDRLGGRLMQCPSTGAGRRQDYTFEPVSRMTNTFILAGEDDLDEMIRTIPRGLFARSLQGGSVDPLTSEFNFAVEEGYWIENGKIDHPVRGATLIGKGSEVLMRIDRVGPNLKRAPGMCGAASGSIPADVGQPQLRISEMIVGGSGGAL